MQDIDSSDVRSSAMPEEVREAEKKAEAVVQKLKELSLTITLSESCTAGLVSALLANTNGASAVFWGSFVCYTQEAKVSMLGLDKKELSAFGLVSRETASSMAEAALKKSGADISVSITGIAGPLGDGSDVPVGTIWAAVLTRDGYIKERKFLFEGSRNAIRCCAAIAALDLVQSVLDSLT